MSDDEMRLTKEDWIFFLNLRSARLSNEEKDNLMAEYFTPKLRAINSSAEILDFEKEENQLTYKEFIRIIQQEER